MKTLNENQIIEAIKLYLLTNDKINVSEDDIYLEVKLSDDGSPYDFSAKIDLQP